MSAVVLIGCAGGSSFDFTSLCGSSSAAEADGGSCFGDAAESGGDLVLVFTSENRSEALTVAAPYRPILGSSCTSTALTIDIQPGSSNNDYAWAQVLWPDGPGFSSKSERESDDARVFDFVSGDLILHIRPEQDPQWLDSGFGFDGYPTAEAEVELRDGVFVSSDSSLVAVGEFSWHASGLQAREEVVPGTDFVPCAEGAFVLP